MKDYVGICADNKIGQLRRLNIVLHERESFADVKRILEIGNDASAQVVDSDHLMAFCEETVDQG